MPLRNLASVEGNTSQDWACHVSAQDIDNLAVGISSVTPRFYRAVAYQREGVLQLGPVNR